jgi:hypothetical protein
VIRGALLFALVAAVPRFLGPPVKKPDAGAPDAGPSPSAPLRPGDPAPDPGLRWEQGARALLIAFGPIGPELTALRDRYAPDGLQLAAVGPGEAVPDEDGSVARAYRGEKPDAPRYFLIGRDGRIRFTTSNAAALPREVERALEN